MKRINVVLVGKTGSGKSSTGNTILQELVFDELISAIDGTEILQMRKGFIDKESTAKLRIYDTPGIMSLKFNEDRSKGSIRKEMNRLMTLAKEVHVFIFVFKFNNRFTKEEAETVKDLKAIFGENFLRNHGMVVITHGDMCDNKAEEERKSSRDLFQEWCKGAGNDFVQLISEVGDNILLVNNKGDFSASSKRSKSSQELRDMIQVMYEQKSSFTKQEFDKINAFCKVM